MGALFSEFEGYADDDLFMKILHEPCQSTEELPSLVFRESMQFSRQQGQEVHDHLLYMVTIKHAESRTRLHSHQNLGMSYSARLPDGTS